MYIIIPILFVILIVLCYILIYKKNKVLIKELKHYEIHFKPENDYVYAGHFLSFLFSPLFIFVILSATKKEMLIYWLCLSFFVIMEILCLIVVAMGKLSTEAIHQDEIYVFRIFKNKTYPLESIFFVGQLGWGNGCCDWDYNKLFYFSIDNNKLNEMINKINKHHPILTITTWPTRQNNITDFYKKLNVVKRNEFINIGKYYKNRSNLIIKKTKIIVHTIFLTVFLLVIALGIIFNLLFLLFLIVILFIWGIIYKLLISSYESKFSYDDFEVGILYYRKYKKVRENEV